MNNRVTIYRVKPDKLEQWSLWCSKIEGPLREEALITLEEENVVMETFTNVMINDETYAIAIMASGDGDKIKNASGDRAINNQHKKQKMQCLDLLGTDTCAYLLLR